MAGLSKEQLGYFDLFGFIVLKQLFNPAEMSAITAEAQRRWVAELGHMPAPGEVANVGRFVEHSPELTRWLVEDDRLFVPLTQLAGEDLVWGGSEGDRGVQSKMLAHHWHADRSGASQIGYLRVKVMLYLDSMHRANGAIRVIPGSHRTEFHMALQQPLQQVTTARDDGQLFFGLTGDQIPAWILETDPGDVLLFNHNLFHAVYGKDAGQRRYVALKLAARPVDRRQRAALIEVSPNVMDPAPEFVLSANPRIRGLVDHLVSFKSA